MPLMSVKTSANSGKVMFLIDCNTYGETDSQPHLRACPMGKTIFEKWHRAILDARYGTPEPDHLKLGEVFCCIDGGKDRKRVATKFCI